MAPTFRLLTPAPAGASGAIAAFSLSGPIDEALRAIGADPPTPVPVGAVALRDLPGVDTTLVARIDDVSALVTAHAGPAVVRALVERFTSAGWRECADDDPEARYPEASDACEALALTALARAASPAAVDLLLDQPARWRAWDGEHPSRREVERVSRELNRLLDPPLVAAVGRTNVGKSTLLNALARRRAAIASAEPGSTRDHVGALLELDGGFVVRWIDTPGVPGNEPDPRSIEARAAELSRAALRGADLVLLCADAQSGFVSPEETTGAPTIRVGTKADLGPAPGADISVSALEGRGLDDLAREVRRMLVSDEALAWPGPWAFDTRLTPSVAGPEERV